MVYFVRIEGFFFVEIFWKFDFLGEVNFKILLIFNFFLVQFSLRLRGSFVVFMGYFVLYVFVKMYLIWVY